MAVRCGYPKGKRPQAARTVYARFRGGQLQGAKGSGMAVSSNKGVSGGVSGVSADSLTMEIGSVTPLSRALP
jgi:hypothetical protein